MRNPNANPTPLDWASFYVEELKYGPGPGQIESAELAEMVAQVEVLLRDARVTSMTGEELVDACEFYAQSIAQAFRCPVVLARSIWMDAMMHGIALAGGLTGDLRRPSEAER